MSSLQLTTPLILSGDPTQPRHASTKQYVDMVLGHPNAMGFTSGTIPVAKLPALTGVVSSNAGENVLTLNNSGVTPGTYTKVMVSSSGRITAGTSTGEDDIQSVDWSRITSGKPTTLAGYGITDVLPPTGGTITGRLKLTQPPSDNLHPVTKAYVDSALLTGDTSLATGDIIRKPTSITPSGFLRVNGGVASKTTYPDLYAKIGDVFGAIDYTGAGQPWKNQFAFNGMQQPGKINYPSIATTASVGLALPQLVVTKNRLYCFSNTNSFTAQITEAGTLTDLTDITPPFTPQYAKVLLTKNRIYAITTLNSSNTVTYFTATIDSEGVIGTWSQTSVTKSSLGSTDMAIVKNKLYIVGGDISNSAQNWIYSADIDSNGVIGPLVTSPSSLPVVLRGHKVFVTKDRIYAIGGVTWGTSSYVRNNNIYSAPINSDGSLGTWGVYGNTPTNEFYGTEIVVVKDRLYAFGGYHPTSGYHNNIYSAAIASSGAVQVWSAVGNLPYASAFGSCAIIKDNILMALGVYGSGFYSQYIHSSSFAGGRSDYSEFYGPQSLGGFFGLPDYSSREGGRLCYYIKT